MADTEGQSLMGIDEGRKASRVNKWLMCGFVVALAFAIGFGAAYASCSNDDCDSVSSSASILRYFKISLKEYPNTWAPNATAAYINWSSSASQDTPVQLTPTSAWGEVSFRTFSFTEMVLSPGQTFNLRLNVGALMYAGRNGTAYANFYQNNATGRYDAAELIKPASYQSGEALITTAAIQIADKFYLWWEVVSDYLDPTANHYGLSISTVSADINTMASWTEIEEDYGQRWWPASVNLYPDDLTGPYQNMAGKFLYAFSACQNQPADLQLDAYCLARWPAYEAQDTTPDYEWFNGVYSNEADPSPSFSKASNAAANTPSVFRAGPDLSLDYSDFLQQWIVIYTPAATRKVQVRTAKQLWGRWSDPVTLLDLPGTIGDESNFLAGAFTGVAWHPTLFENNERVLYFSFQIIDDNQMPHMYRLELDWLA